MALIKCVECGKEISNLAISCPNCGAPIAAKRKDVTIRFPLWEGQLFNNKCFVYNKDTDEVIAKCRQGETVSFECCEPINIYVVVKGSFGKPEAKAYPGDRFDVAYRGFGKIFISKVDSLTGPVNSSGIKTGIAFGVFKKF